MPLSANLLLFLKTYYIEKDVKWEVLMGRRCLPLVRILIFTEDHRDDHWLETNCSWRKKNAISLSPVRRMTLDCRSKGRYNLKGSSLEQLVWLPLVRCPHVFITSDYYEQIHHGLRSGSAFVLTTDQYNHQHMLPIPPACAELDFMAP